MNYWRMLECENYTKINQQILTWIEDNLDISANPPFWNPVDAVKLINSCPLFKQWLLDQKLFVKSIAVTYGTNTTCCGIHIDTPPARFKLSWPVKNTKDSWNRWFDDSTVDNSDKLINALGGTSYKNTSNLKEIVRKELIAQPCLIDASVPHDVWYEDNTKAIFPRIGLQCQLIKEPNTL